MTFNAYAEEIHRIAVEHGFWEGDRNFGEQIALMHSELSEALEEHRSHRPLVYFSGGIEYVGREGQTETMNPSASSVDDKGNLRKPEGVAVELVDCLIRILDTLEHLKVDVDDVVTTKMAYNASRPYKHNRAY